MRRGASLLLAVGFGLVACGDGAPTAEPGLFFPLKPREDGAVMEALFRGRLVVRNGCILIGPPGEYSLPIWWEGFTTGRNDAGRRVVRDSRGAVVAVEGETFEMGGGYVAEFRPEARVEAREDQLRTLERWLGYEIPGRCLGPDVDGVWSVGET